MPVIKSGIVICLLFGALLFVFGCADQTSHTLSPLEFAENMPREQRLAYFNQAIQRISDEASALVAVEMFNHYVKSRLFSDLTGGNEAANKYVIPEERMKTIAKAEAQLRNPDAIAGLSPLEANLLQINSEQVMERLTVLSPQIAGKYSTRFLSVLATVRQELPALSVYKDDRMTPLESLVAGYAFYCGDDGSAQTGSIRVAGSRSDVEQFVGSMF